MGINSFDLLAFPVIGSAQEIKGIGMSKRELFAALMMQALVNHPDYQNEPYTVAYESCVLADALIDCLNKQKD